VADVQRHADIEPQSRGSQAREAGSTIYHRRFHGGHLSLVGANSPAGLASRPIKYLLFDEIDRWEESAACDGDPAALAIARTRTFWNRKIVMCSSPTIKGASRIELAFLESDQRYYTVSCPLCKHLQRLIWQRVEWPECFSCDVLSCTIPRFWRESQAIQSGTVTEAELTCDSLTATARSPVAGLS
jgi:phage terminase large subunit GpA-like protein